MTRLASLRSAVPALMLALGLVACGDDGGANRRSSRASMLAGTASVAEIVADLETAFGATGLRPDVEAFLDMARQQRWVELA